MAARRYYAYYIRGQQLALVEHDNVSGSGQTLGQPSLDDIVTAVGDVTLWVFDGTYWYLLYWMAVDSNLPDSSEGGF